ncbi:Flp1 family type IVb pilin [Anaerosporobacter sp.]|uniref:Flp1 family type IVb pilin n=1 Tax=Anaerosporobacter sp. TaxID=1872529 RepID=UPI00286F7578|nr:Flp1 family type IVb pilin [Anaerosporobacter sp.]
MKKEIQNIVKGFIKEEDGLGIVELVLIIIILIALVVLFKGEVEKFISELFKKATGKTNTL